MNTKTVLILGANSDVAKQAMIQYVAEGHRVIAASRSVNSLVDFVQSNQLDLYRIEIIYFDAVDFDSHERFYNELSEKPHIVLYAAGFLVDNLEALVDWKRTYQMMNVHYCGAVSIINILASDVENSRLERIIGLSSLSGVRGRKSNFIYGSSKSAFTQYMAGLRQHLFNRKIKVNVIVAGYIRSKMVDGLDLSESLLLEPSFIARSVVNIGNSFITIPGWKWKGIYYILRLLPESLVARLP